MLYVKGTHAEPLVDEMHLIPFLNQSHNNQHNILISVLLLTVILVILHEADGHLMNSTIVSHSSLYILITVIYFSQC